MKILVNILIVVFTLLILYNTYTTVTEGFTPSPSPSPSFSEPSNSSHSPSPSNSSPSSSSTPADYMTPSDSHQVKGKTVSMALASIADSLSK